MNIFVLDNSPHVAAQMHCDKHVVKMILEYGQLLSTAHRLLDGQVSEVSWVDVQGKARKKRVHLLGDERYGFNDDMTKLVYVNAKCYAASHMQHPAGVWVRSTDMNYSWLFELFEECLREYTHRYGRQHAAERIRPFLSRFPRNLPQGELLPFPLSMPQEYKVADAVQSYHNYYVGAKTRFARWTNRSVPEWFATRIPDGTNVAHFERTRPVL